MSIIDQDLATAFAETIIDQNLIMSFAEDRWRDNPQPCYIALDWNDFSYHNAGNPRKILVRAESDISIQDANEKLIQEIERQGDLHPRCVIYGLCEKRPSITMQQLMDCRNALSELIPGCILLQEVIWSDRTEAIALLFME